MLKKLFLVGSVALVSLALSETAAADHCRHGRHSGYRNFRPPVVVPVGVHVHGRHLHGVPAHGHAYRSLYRSGYRGGFGYGGFGHGGFGHGGFGHGGFGHGGFGQGHPYGAGVPLGGYPYGAGRGGISLNFGF